MVHVVKRALALALLLVLAACARGPDTAAVQQAIQKQLDDALGGRVLTVAHLTRAGGVPLKDAPGRLVYFNAELELARDYDFTRWDAHSVASLANLLGAGPKGVFGIASEGNKAGDTIGVYGSAAFAETSGRFALLPATPPDIEKSAAIPTAAVVGVRPPVREAPPPTPAQAALASLQELFAADTARARFPPASASRFSRTSSGKPMPALVRDSIGQRRSSSSQAAPTAARTRKCCARSTRAPSVPACCSARCRAKAASATCVFSISARRNSRWCRTTLRAAHSEAAAASPVRRNRGFAPSPACSPR
jgi:hypothetical protein